MALNLIDRLGEWNPQWFREIKGRFKFRNLLTSVIISLLSQLLVLVFYSGQLPAANKTQDTYSKYCTGTSHDYSPPTCLANGFGGFEINWWLWWQDVFIGLSIVGLFALLVVGTYMLIADLSTEERRGTLNFLRLTPQSTHSILGGKLLGAPILLYLVVALALPLHLYAGLVGKIPLAMILGFYGILAVSCLFFFSGALLFSLVGKWLGSFQAWLAAGTVLIFLLITTSVVHHSGVSHFPFDWLTLFNPAVLLPYLIDSNSLDPAGTPYYGRSFVDLLWFSLPVGSTVWSLATFTIVINYGFGIYWFWQALNRSFHKPTATLLSKQQSYWLMAGFEVVLLGFALNPEVYDSRSKAVFNNFSVLLVFNLVLFIGTIIALSPHRQTLQDWARYRHRQRSSRKNGLIADLVWGEQSPALVAVMLNLVIASSVLLPWILLWPASQYKVPAIWGLLLTMSICLVYATIAQLMLWMKTQKRAIWAAATIAGAIALPPFILEVLSMTPYSTPTAWLFSAFPWAGVEYAAASSVLLAVMGQSLVVVLGSVQLTRLLRKAGESSTKALLSRREKVALR